MRRDAREHQLKDSESRKISSGVLDERTMMTLYKMSNKGMFKKLYGVIKSGKESSVLIAETEEGKNIAIKIYAIDAANFKKMQPYLIGDARFSRIKKDKQSFVFAWCQKEFQNLQRARKCGVNCPEAIGFSKNVLAMEFLGKDMKPFPRLVNAELKDYNKIFKKIVKNMKTMYQKAKIVHTDLSEYNILIDDKENPWIIDFSQSLMITHPNAEYFLQKDVKNICNYFNRHGVECDAESLCNDIKGYKD